MYRGVASYFSVLYTERALARLWQQISSLPEAVGSGFASGLAINA